jgi:hypothetical protein
VVVVVVVVVGGTSTRDWCRGACLADAKGRAAAQLTYLTALFGGESLIFAIVIVRTTRRRWSQH